MVAVACGLKMARSMYKSRPVDVTFSYMQVFGASQPSSPFVAPPTSLPCIESPQTYLNFVEQKARFVDDLQNHFL
jgi:hypothetical protein